MTRFHIDNDDDPASGKSIFLKLHAFVLEINSHHSLSISILYMISLYAIDFSCVHVNI
jgi:hypothetical protein